MRVQLAKAQSQYCNYVTHLLRLLQAKADSFMLHTLMHREE